MPQSSTHDPHTPHELPFPEQPEADGRHAELLKELWEAAVKLRGTAAAADHKR